MQGEEGGGKQDFRSNLNALLAGQQPGHPGGRALPPGAVPIMRPPPPSYPPPGVKPKKPQDESEPGERNSNEHKGSDALRADNLQAQAAMAVAAAALAGRAPPQQQQQQQPPQQGNAAAPRLPASAPPPLPSSPPPVLRATPPPGASNSNDSLPESPALRSSAGSEPSVSPASGSLTPVRQSAGSDVGPVSENPAVSRAKGDGTPSPGPSPAASPPASPSLARSRSLEQPGLQEHPLLVTSMSLRLPLVHVAGIKGVLDIQMPLPPTTLVRKTQSKVKARRQSEPNARESEWREDAQVREDLLPRHAWEALAMKRHPDVLELAEKMRAVIPRPPYSRLRAVGRTEVGQLLSRDVVLQLIMQHLKVTNHSSTLEALESEAKLAYQHSPARHSLLLAQLWLAVKDTDRDIDLVLPSSNEDWKESEMRHESRGMGMLSLGVGKDQHLYAEPTNKHTLMEMEAPLKGIKAATLNQIVKKLTDADFEGRYQFMKMCLLTYRSFTTPERFLHKLMQRYDVPPPNNHTLWSDEERDKWEATVCNPIRLQVLQVLKRWVEGSFTDFSAKMLHVLGNFIVNKIMRHNHSWAKSLRDTIDRAQQGKTYIRNPVTPPDPKVPRSICSPSLSWSDVDEEEIARQLTIMAHEHYSAIKPLELLNQAWIKADTRHRSPNVLAMQRQGSATAVWCTVQVLSEPRPKDRARVMMRLVKVAKILHTLHNFDTLAAVLQALTTGPVARLKRTNEELGAATTATLRALRRSMEPGGDRSFSSYRRELHSVNPPCIPHLFAHLTELTFIEEQNPNTIKGLVNVYKRQLVSNVIFEVQQYQDTPYHFHPVPQIHQLFVLKKDQNALMQEMEAKSIEYEPM